MDFAFSLSPYLFGFFVLALPFVVEADFFWLAVMTIGFLATGYGAAVVLAGFTFGLLLAHPVYLLAGLGLYVVGGSIVGPIAWLNFIHKMRDDYDDRYADYRRVNPKATNEEAHHFAVHAFHGQSLPPQIRDNKARFTRWMAYWPFTTLRLLLKDLVLRIWTSIYKLYATRLQAMSNKLFSDITPRDA